MIFKIINDFIFYVISYVTFPPFARAIQNHAILILLAGFELPGVSKIIFRVAVVLYFAYAASVMFLLGFPHI